VTEVWGIPEAYGGGELLDVLPHDPWPLDRPLVAAIGDALANLIAQAPPAWQDLTPGEGWTGRGAVLANEVANLIYLAVGSGALTAGVGMPVLLQQLDRWRTAPYGPTGPGALARQSWYRLPGGALLDALGVQPRAEALRWKRSVLVALGAIPPLRPRSDALIALIDARLASATAMAADDALPAWELPARWARDAPSSLLDDLPELYGSVGSVTWWVRRLDALEAEAGSSPADVDLVIADQLRRFGWAEPPAPMGLALDQTRDGRSGAVAELLRGDPPDWRERDGALHQRLVRLTLTGRHPLARRHAGSAAHRPVRPAAVPARRGGAPA
jgi:hypothetical protein